MSDIEIRTLKSWKEYLACERLQKRIWGFHDRDIVPATLLKVANEQGGLTAGAFLGGGMVGFVFGFPTLVDGKQRHHSDMTGVEKRNEGIGCRLKLFQRDFVTSQGLDLITWTFDPLESANANLNFRKLGAISREYRRNYYGEMRDRLNIGLPTDRLFVEWWIRSERVKRRIEGQERGPDLERGLSMGKIVNETRSSDGSFRKNVRIDLSFEDDFLLIEIPPDIQRMKTRNMRLARRWRRDLRTMMENLLGRGYMATDFIYERDGARTRSFYLLRKVSRLEDILS